MQAVSTGCKSENFNLPDCYNASMHALSPEELLNYCSEETARWGEWFKANPAAGGVAANIAGNGNVREVVLHIAAVELRYAERLLEQPATDFAQLASQTMDDVFSIFARSQDYMREFLSQVKEEDWGKVITFETRSAGTLSASKRKVFVHACLHGVRHWAQLATLLRQQGHKQDWPHDFIFSKVVE